MFDLMPGSDDQGQGYISIINRVSGLMIQKNAINAIELNKPDIIIDIPINSARTFDFYRATKLIQKGKIAANTSIGEYLSRNHIYAEKAVSQGY